MCGCRFAGVELSKLVSLFMVSTLWRKEVPKGAMAGLCAQACGKWHTIQAGVVEVASELLVGKASKCNEDK